MIADRASAVLDLAVDLLGKSPWLRDPEAAKNSLRFNLMCETGVNVVIDPNNPANRMRYTGLTPERVIEQALGGDRIAHEALCNVAAHLTDFGRVVPAKLQRYIIDAARAAAVGKRGRHPVTNLLRDDAIFHVVEKVVGQGLKATRNEVHSGDSACSIVSTALARCGINMSESAVVTIWKARRLAHKRAGYKAPS
jgi:hypothetical protein